MAKRGTPGGCSAFPRRSTETMRLIVSAIIGVAIGYLVGISFPTVNITKLTFPSNIISYIEDRNSGLTTQALLNHAWNSANNQNRKNSTSTTTDSLKIYVPSNPRGAERLPPKILVRESDFYLRRLWGNPEEGFPEAQVGLGRLGNPSSPKGEHYEGAGSEGERRGQPRVGEGVEDLLVVDVEHHVQSPPRRE
ncbi:uncharacterized protein LOC141817901, partial [Curcuma longa]|uniref:uncharacterized protein LOC141817901 n=1 Tax=Curcuma longa TaxID=136217 RepID=UPI003D9F4FB7